jgi:hypothetical protein
MRLIFRRSDALVERGFPGVDDIELDFPGDVQLTYGVLRECDTSNPIAHINYDEEWFIEPRFIDIKDHGPYSDVLFFTPTKENA